MWERCRELVEAQGAKVVHGAPRSVDASHHDGGRAVAVIAEPTARTDASTPAPRHLVDADVARCSRAMDPPAPADGAGGRRRPALPRLPHRRAGGARRTVGFPDNWIYIHDARGQGRPHPELRLVVAVPGQGRPHLPRPRVLRLRGRRAGGPRPTRSSIALGKRELDELGLVDAGRRSRPATSCGCPRRTRCTTSATRPTSTCMRGVARPSTRPTCTRSGRNGMHKYNNQDHSMFTAMLTRREHPRAPTTTSGTSTSRRSTTRRSPPPPAPPGGAPAATLR